MPIARTMVNASTNSTNEARKTATANPTTALVNI